MEIRKYFIILLVGLVSLVSIVAVKAQEDSNMRISSPAFEHSTPIPIKFTCQGQDVNPELLIEGAPARTKSLALIMDDPDAPMGTWVHWVVYNIKPVSRIEENSIPGKQCMNNFRRESYGGPCPPSGTHRYFFKIYALDTELNLLGGATKGALEQAMRGHVLDKAELIGLYQKK